MSYTVKLEAFEGPFDLLFHLIEKSKVDIYNIPIAQITEQYLEYLNTLQIFDLEIASEFLVMAATLIEIKSKMLLPDKKEDQLSMDIDEEDPRQDLVKRLIEYRKFKNAAQEFKKREDLYKKIFYKPQEELDQYIEQGTKELLELDLEDLLEAFQKLLDKRKKQDDQEIKFNNIEREEISIEKKIDQIKNQFIVQNFLYFHQLILNTYSKAEAIITFLATLELIKIKYILIKQDKVFGEIIITRNTSGVEVQNG